MIGSFGWMELLLILFIVLIIFGAGKIPQLGEGLGKAIKGFKKSIHEPDAMDVTPQPDDAGTAGQGAPAAETAPPPQPGQLAEPPTAHTAAPSAQQPVGERPQPASQAQEPRQG